MNAILRYSLVATFLCVVSVVFAQNDYPEYQKDNDTYGCLPFINLSDMPDLIQCMPAPPAWDSPEISYDMQRYVWGKRVRSEDPSRLAVVIADSEWDDLEKVYANFKDAFGLKVTKEDTPIIYELLTRSLRTTDPTRRAVKAHYKRTRPFVYAGDPTATGEDAGLSDEGGYPSGHTLRGWVIMLVMTQVAPERAAHLYQRAMDYSYSRVIAGCHWESDVDNTRWIASLLYSVLQTSDEYQKMVKSARQEYRKAAIPHLLPE